VSATARVQWIFEVVDSVDAAAASNNADPAMLLLLEEIPAPSSQLPAHPTWCNYTKKRLNKKQMKYKTKYRNKHYQRKTRGWFIFPPVCIIFYKANKHKKNKT